MSPVTFRAGFVVDVDSMERQALDVLADSLLQLELLKASFSPGVSHPLLGEHIIEALPVEESFSNGLPEDGVPMIATALTSASKRATVVSQPIP